MVRGALSAAVAVPVALVAGCSAESGEQTALVFDGQSYTIDGPVSCTRQVDRRLVIIAPVAPKWGGGVPGRGRRLIRVELTDEARILVKQAAIRIDDIRGFVNDPAEMWATKADNTYTINGRMPPAQGETGSHQFKIEVTCSVVEQKYDDVGPPPIGAP